MRIPVQEKADLAPASELMAVCGQGGVKSEFVHADTLRQAGAGGKRRVVPGLPVFNTMSGLVKLVPFI
jgi:hypothetical protein